MKRKILLTIVFALAIFPLLIGGPSATANSYDERKEVHQTLELTPGASVEIDTIAGSVEIETSANQIAEINAVLSSPTRADLDCNQLTIEHTSGGLLIRGASSHCKVSRGSQQLQLKLPRQINLSLRMIAGSIKVPAIDGFTKLDSIAGHAHVALAHPAEMSSLARGLTIELGKMSGRGLRISSVVGGIDLGVSRDIDADLSVSSFVGQIENEINDASLVESRDGDFRLRFGAGGSRIQISSVRGTIKIHRLGQG